MSPSEGTEWPACETGTVWHLTCILHLQMHTCNKGHTCRFVNCKTACISRTQILLLLFLSNRALSEGLPHSMQQGKAVGLVTSDDTDGFIGNVGSSGFGSKRRDGSACLESTHGNGQCSGPAVCSVLTAEHSSVWLFPCLSMTEVHFTVNSRAYAHLSPWLYTFVKKRRYLLSRYRFVAEL